jgi:hypothetical protein
VSYHSSWIFDGSVTAEVGYKCVDFRPISVIASGGDVRDRALEHDQVQDLQRLHPVRASWSVSIPMRGNASEEPFRVGRSETGLGLFATDVIEKGTFIIEYAGPRTPTEEVPRRRSTRYLFEINSRWTIDGSPRWNTARYINSAADPP